MTDLPLAGRKALITGAGTGIGRAIARALARDGAAVAITDLDERAAEQAAAEIGALAWALDVTDPETTDDVFEDAAARLGGLDLVCANAGSRPCAPWPISRSPSGSTTWRSTPRACS